MSDFGADGFPARRQRNRVHLFAIDDRAWIRQTTDTNQLCCILRNIGKIAWAVQQLYKIWLQTVIITGVYNLPQYR